ncbi:hypothetical protein ADK57_31365 [Streptomyces sp. MMG1533]|uniref:hypothetical protein n=1 Tax=Streptomyces sp. MMG1533 TaxID=1415546 RepID=UPI0006ADB87F|nr:hypothetical protein ADK57_31365 [Streptomyces sp. MMG1533]
MPLEPVLQWREQLITDEDVLDSQIANTETWEALRGLAARLTEDEWRPRRDEWAYAARACVRGLG